jgi:hypothetical protein
MLSMFGLPDKRSSTVPELHPLMVTYTIEGYNKRIEHFQNFIVSKLNEIQKPNITFLFWKD